jgi:hypothetical protein
MLTRRSPTLLKGIDKFSPWVTFGRGKPEFPIDESVPEMVAVSVVTESELELGTGDAESFG